MVQAIVKNDLDGVRIATESFAQKESMLAVLNTRSKPHRGNAINHAARFGYADILLYLISKGGNLNDKNGKENRNAVEHAFYFAHYECACILLQAGAVPMLSPEQNPLEYAGQSIKLDTADADTLSKYNQIRDLWQEYLKVNASPLVAQFVFTRQHIRDKFDSFDYWLAAYGVNRHEIPQNLSNSLLPLQEWSQLFDDIEAC